MMGTANDLVISHKTDYRFRACKTASINGRSFLSSLTKFVPIRI